MFGDKETTSDIPPVARGRRPISTSCKGTTPYFHRLQGENLPFSPVARGRRPFFAGCEGKKFHFRGLQGGDVPFYAGGEGTKSQLQPDDVPCCGCTTFLWV